MAPPSPSPSPRPPAGRRRVILHCDAAAFFCQVERQLRPDLYGSVPALAVFQHGDVISADAGAKRLGVRKRDSPAAARRALVAGGGALAHVHVARGHRVSYRPYDTVSKAMHRVLRSKEMADALLRVCGFANRDRAESNGLRRDESPPESRDARDEASRTGIQSAESPLRSPAKARRCVVVERASIDEAYVQLPSGCSLGEHAAPCADAIRRAVAEKLGLVLSVGAARNKTLAKFASAAAKPDGVKVVAEKDESLPSRVGELRRGAGEKIDFSRNDAAAASTSKEATATDVRSSSLAPTFISESALLRATPCSKLHGCGGARVAERMRDALRCETVADVAALAGDADRVADRIFAATGVPKPTATRVANAARGVCDEPVRDIGARKKSVGVHFSLATTPRRMPPEAVAIGTVSAAGGRPGWFEPVRAGERARVSHAVDAMSRDLAERVWDECEDDDEPDDGDDDVSRRETSSERRREGPSGNDAPRPRPRRWPKTLVASVALAGGSVSRRGAFPARPANLNSAEDAERADPEVPEVPEVPRVAEDAVAAAAKALVETATSRADPAALVTKLSLVATDIRTIRTRGGGGGGVTRPDDSTAIATTAAPRSLVSSFFPALPAAAETAREAAPESAAARKRERGANEVPPKDAADETREGRRRRLDGSEPIDAGDAWRAFARGEMCGADFYALKRRRVEWLGERRRR